MGFGFWFFILQGLILYSSRCKLWLYNIRQGLSIFWQWYMLSGLFISKFDKSSCLIRLPCHITPIAKEGWSKHLRYIGKRKWTRKNKIRRWPAHVDLKYSCAVLWNNPLGTLECINQLRFFFILNSAWNEFWVLICQVYLALNQENKHFSSGS